jgi:L-amino acid N-acyltransferase YncA
MNVSFEPLCDEYRKDVIDILNYYISSTTAAFRDEIVDYDYFNNFLDKESVYLGYVIKNEENTVIGFCTLEPFKNIKPFKKTAEVMYFVEKEYIGKGVGAKTLARLENDARDKGISKLVVDITDDNEQSISFHERNGFKEYGRLNRCWNKSGKDLGIVYMEKNI